MMLHLSSVATEVVDVKAIANKVVDVESRPMRHA